jgi:hypothetical protein
MFQVNLCQGFSGTDGGGAGSACTVAAPAVLNTTSRYDRLGMLVSQATSGALAQAYRYDKAGNLAFRQDGNVSHYYNVAPESNRLFVDSIPGQTSSQVLFYGYTASGSRLREYTYNAATGGNDEKRFYYDGMGRPTGIRDFDHDGAGRATCMRYDADGQLAMPCDDNPSWLTFDGPSAGARGGHPTTHCPQTSHGCVSCQRAPIYRVRQGAVARHSQLVGPRGPSHLHGRFGSEGMPRTRLEEELRARVSQAVKATPSTLHRQPSRRSLRDQYILKVWILRVALPIVVFTVVLGILDFGLTARQILSWRFLAVMGATAAVAILLAILDWKAVIRESVAAQP